MKDRTVLSFDAIEWYEVQQIVLDGDRDEALKYLAQLSKRLEEAMTPK
jgi:hypothetical protein